MLHFDGIDIFNAFIQTVLNYEKGIVDCEKQKNNTLKLQKLAQFVFKIKCLK